MNGQTRSIKVKKVTYLGMEDYHLDLKVHTDRWYGGQSSHPKFLERRTRKTYGPDLIYIAWTSISVQQLL